MEAGDEHEKAPEKKPFFFLPVNRKFVGQGDGVSRMRRQGDEDGQGHEEAVRKKIHEDVLDLPHDPPGWKVEGWISSRVSTRFPGFLAPSVD